MSKRASTIAQRNSESTDDYLMAVYMLGADSDRRVGSSELATHLGVAPASITNMLQRLGGVPKPLVDYKRSQGVRLTAAGRRRALEIVRHHRLIETFLFRTLKYPMDDLHDEAERLEHFISEKFEERIAAVLNHPDADPHGHCIPSLDGTMPARHGKTCSCGK